MTRRSADPTPRTGTRPRAGTDAATGACDTGPKPTDPWAAYGAALRALADAPDAVVRAEREAEARIGRAVEAATAEHHRTEAALRAVGARLDAERERAVTLLRDAGRPTRLDARGAPETDRPLPAPSAAVDAAARAVDALDAALGTARQRERDADAQRRQREREEARRRERATASRRVAAQEAARRAEQQHAAETAAAANAEAVARRDAARRQTTIAAAIAVVVVLLLLALLAA